MSDIMKVTALIYGLRLTSLEAKIMHEEITKLVDMHNKNKEKKGSFHDNYPHVSKLHTELMMIQEDD